MAVIPSDFTRLDPRLAHEVVTVGSGVAGAGFTKTVPADVLWNVRTVSFLYTASNQAATRIPRVEFLDGSGNVFAAVGSPFTLTANNAARFTFGIGLELFGANNAAQIGASLPDLTLVGGLAVRVAVTAIQTNDAISLAALFVDQFPVADMGG